MSHLERALDGQNQFWKYLINFLASIVGANLLGSIPLFLIVIIKSIESGGTITPNPDNFADLTVYGVSSNVGLILLLLPFVAGLFTCIILLKPLHKRMFAEVVNGTKKIRWNRFFHGFSIWLVLYAIYLVIDITLNPSNFVFQLELRTFIPLLIISLLLLPLQTTLEELLFRGYLGQAVAAWTGSRWLVIILPAVCFGLLHSANPEIKEYGFWAVMPQYILFGLVFGLITVLDDGIELSMGVHAANNIFASVFITSKSSVLQTPAVFSAQIINPNKETIMLFIMSLVLILFLARKYNWKFNVLNKRVKAEVENKPKLT